MMMSGRNVDQRWFWDGRRFASDLRAATPQAVVRTNAAVARMMLNLKDLGIHASEEGGNPLTDAASVTGYLGLGSNVGDRVANLRAAADALPVVARSSVYETEPQGEVPEARTEETGPAQETAPGPADSKPEMEASREGTKAGGAGTPVTLPALGESVTEGTVTRWLKQVGDEVAVDEPLLEVSTDKVDTEIPSPAAGVLQRIIVGEDETVAVGAELARVVERLHRDQRIGLARRAAGAVAGQHEHIAHARVALQVVHAHGIVQADGAAQPAAQVRMRMGAILPRRAPSPPTTARRRGPPAAVVRRRPWRPRGTARRAVRAPDPRRPAAARWRARARSPRR